MNEHSHMYNIQNHMQIHMLEQLSDQEFWDHAQSLATQENRPSTTSEEYLECHTEQGHYLLPLQALCEVVPPPYKFTLLPLHPVWMLGITAWRGHVIPVVDLASYFISHATDEPGTTQHTYPDTNSTLLILDNGNLPLGIQIASVGSIITLEHAQLVSPEQVPPWYPQHLLSTLLSVYNGSVILNPQVLIAEMMQQIKVSATYE